MTYTTKCLLLVHFSTNSNVLASIFGDSRISAGRTASCYTKIVSKTLLLVATDFILCFKCNCGNVSYLSEPLLFTRGD
jgi:hypothetical protein